MNNREMITLLLVGSMGVGVGSVAGWLAGRRASLPTRGYEVRTRAILTNPEGHPVGELAPGVVIVTSAQLNPESDVGWWGYVPVTFGTGTEAARILQKSSERLESPVTVTVRALLPGDLPSPTERP